MEKELNIRPYPWHALESVPREAAAMLREVRSAVEQALDVPKIAGVLAELLGERVHIVLQPLEVATAGVAPLLGPRFSFATEDDAVRIQIDLEADLARTLVARILHRPVRAADPRAANPPEVDGATFAILLQVARRAHGADRVLKPLGAGALSLPVGERRLVLRASVHLGHDAYTVQAVVEIRKLKAAARATAAQAIAWLGDLPLSLPVIAAISSAPAGEVYALARGDVWMPGPGWFLHPVRSANAPLFELAGEVLLAPPDGSRAIAGKIGDGGQIVVVGTRSIPVDEENAMAAADQENDTTTSEVILDAPLVVRVELGAVTMPVREWAALVPGDIIPMGRRVSDPVVLRSAGLEIGRGELVEIEGELGIRIRERIRPA